MVWEWQTWRCVGDLAEEFEARGWEVGFKRDELPPVLGRSGGYCIVFCSLDPEAGECSYELRGDRRAVAVRGIPPPEKASELLARHGAPVGIRITGGPLETLPVARSAIPR